LRDAASTGLVTIGSHTHTHALLDRAEPADIGAELDRSIELIGQHIGAAPVHFAYPKALPGSEAAEGEVRRRFITAALARSRVNKPARPTCTGSGAPRSNAATATTSSPPRPPGDCASKANSATSSPGSSTAARRAESCPTSRRSTIGTARSPR
jgi:hypothetical protein